MTPMNSMVRPQNGHLRPLASTCARFSSLMNTVPQSWHS